MKVMKVQCIGIKIIEFNCITEISTCMHTHINMRKHKLLATEKNKTYVCINEKLA